MQFAETNAICRRSGGRGVRRLAASAAGILLDILLGAETVAMMNYLQGAVLVALTAAAASRVGAKEMQVPDRVRTAIEAVIAGEDAAWDRGDATAFAAAATDDVVFTNVVGMFTVGRDPFARQSARIFAGRYRGSRLVQTIDHIQLVRPDVAIVSTLLSVTGYESLPPGAQSDDGVLRTRCEQVMVVEDGRWRAASFHNVPVNLAAIAAAGPP